jgi:hypothetical protein
MDLLRSTTTRIRKIPFLIRDIIMSYFRYHLYICGRVIVYIICRYVHIVQRHIIQPYFCNGIDLADCAYGREIRIRIMLAYGGLV